jgi:diacylglycerol kinase family enzyme
MSKLFMSMLFPSVLAGLHGCLKTVSFVDCERVEAEFDGALDLNIDGNIYPASGFVNFEIAKDALTVFV